jgi:uncharacterized surface protein with fasciclin (FAS1) repeats
VGVSAALGALSTAGFVDSRNAHGESNEAVLDIAEDITVFIPNDEAFIAIASAFQNATLDTLKAVLSYHAVQGAVVFANEITNTTVGTVGGENLTLSVGTDGVVYVDNARVVLPNIILSNGVAHIIDR